MKIIKCNFYRYRIPLSISFSISVNKIDSREGIIIVLEDDNGLRGMGDIVPLPGLSSESIDDVLIILAKIKHFLHNKVFNTGDLFYDDSFPPSVRFAVESAIFSLFAERKKIPLAKMINIGATENVMINALLLRGDSSDIDKIERIKRCGYSSVKIKVSSETLEKDVENILNINKLLKGKISFRIDANRSLTIAEAEIFLKMIEDVSLDYFEEPLKKANLLPQLYEKSGCHYGLDESLLLMVSPNEILPKGLKAAIIKPQLYGSWLEIKELINKLKESGIQIVISDIFSSGVGLNSLLQYAAAIGQEGLSMGFDTYSYLQNDILTKRLPIKEGKININDAGDCAKKLDYAKMIRLDI